MPRDLPSPELLRKLLRYDPETGEMFWMPRNISEFKNKGLWSSWMSSRAGTRCGYVDKKGYRLLHIFGGHVQEHRICWAVFYGNYPKGIIDHINGIPSDNRIENLRDVTNSENMRNKRFAKNNSSGVTGVSFHKATEKWRVQIGTGSGPKKHIGIFENFNDAVLARLNAEAEYGYTDRHGKQ